MVEYDDLQAELLATFEVELAEHLAAMNAGLLLLEKQPSDTEKERVVAGLFRAAHSVKGAARAVGLEQIGTLAHGLEDVFRAIQRQTIDVASETIDVLLPSVDALAEAMASHQNGGELERTRVRDLLGCLRDLSEGKTNVAPAPCSVPDEAPNARAADSAPPAAAVPVVEASSDAPQPVSETGPASDAVRVATSKIDAMMNGAGELLGVKMHAEQRVSEHAGLWRQVSQLRRDWRRARPQINQLRRRYLEDAELSAVLEMFAESEQRLDVLDAEAGGLHGNLTSDLAHLGNLTEELQSGARQLRMLPMGSLFDSFARMVRDLARDEGKRVELRVSGRDSEVDRTVLELLKDPLVHLLRNAVGHGIEDPSRRQLLGKREQGNLHLDARQTGNTILVSLRDDGAGIDVLSVRKRAIELGLVDRSHSETLSDSEVLDLIFTSGFSTAAQTTQLSGRGVGLDIVRENITRMGGTISVDTDPGHGTLFTMKLPLTLATRHVLLVEVSGQTVALPVSAVERIQYVRSEDTGSAEGRRILRVGDRSVPLVPLGAVLQYGAAERSGMDGMREEAVIVGIADRRIAFRIDSVRGTREVVVKSLDKRLQGISAAAGAAVLGSGDVVIVLHPLAIAQAAEQGHAVAASAPAMRSPNRRKTILVVDDSITTRTLERSILERQGYRVFVAADGLAGWNAVRAEEVDLVVSDVDMPRMTGVELTERIRGDAALEKLPVILLTSLDAEDDRLRGLEAGANAYLTKGTFDQRGLLETITGLIGGQA